MIRKFKIVRINSDYCDYLRRFDSKVAYNASNKELRSFVGVLFIVNNYEYFAPLSSPKAKHLLMKNSIDFLKIDEGKLGVINFNNMIPVKPAFYSLLDLNSKPINKADLNRQNLLKNQVYWLNKNYIDIKNKALKLYNKYNENKLYINIKKRCCNFVLLEEKSLEYKKNN